MTWEELDEDARANVASILNGILFREWDPIGVRRMEKTGAEYRSYVHPLIARLARGASPEQIAAYLHQSRTGSMGLRANPASEAKIAERCCQVWDQLVTNHTL